MIDMVIKYVICNNNVQKEIEIAIKHKFNLEECILYSSNKCRRGLDRNIKYIFN